MSRKRRNRKTRPTVSAPALVVPPAAAAAPVGRLPRIARAAGRMVPVLRSAVRVLVWIGLLFLAASLAVVGVLRWRGALESWPTHDEIGLSVPWAAVGALALILSSAIVYVAHRAFCGGRLRTVRVCLLIVLALALFVLGLRMREYYALHQNGVAPWSLETSVFDDVSVYYVSAVKERLRVLARDLETRLADHPDRISDADRRRLGLVTTLQASLVSWTEQEVGHWLDDAQLRRELMGVMAYQIHPTARRRDMALGRIEVERGDLERRRRCFQVLRAYCRQEPASGPQRAAELTETLRRLGAGEWSFAEAVVRDAHDATMIGERLNQIETSLSSIDAREAYVREYLDPLRDSPTAAGLNRRFPGLRLPISFPQARAWTLSYLLLTGLHSVVLLLAVLTLFAPPVGRGIPTLDPPRAPHLWCWHATVVMGIIVFVAVYGC